MFTLREGNGNPFRYSCLENPIDSGVWWAAVYGVVKSWTWLSDLTLTFHFHPLEKEMATHSSVLAWRIPETGEPGGLPSTGSHRVGHDWSDLAAAAVAVFTLSSLLIPPWPKCTCVLSFKLWNTWKMQCSVHVWEPLVFFSIILQDFLLLTYLKEVYFGTISFKNIF